jgi:hypothetical protein
VAQNGQPLFGRNSSGANQILGTPKLDPFKNARGNPFDAVLPTTPEVVKKVRDTYENAVPIILPRQMAAPEGARTIDLVKVITVPDATTLDIYQFQCRPGSTTIIFGYSLWSSAVFGSDLIWTPTIDGRRVLQNHGAPSANGVNIIQTPVGNADQMESIISCQILMEPGQIFKWTATNNSGAPVKMAARTVGYFDMSQRLTSSKFGD